MPLTPDQAATIARHHGLSLQDAAGLLTLADDIDAAERIASTFANSDGQMRGFVRQLLGTTERAGATSA